MYRGSIATALARLHNNFQVIDVVKPIYKETWWAEQLKEREREKILFYRGRSLLTEVSVGTIGHVDYGKPILEAEWRWLTGDVDFVFKTPVGCDLPY